MKNKITLIKGDCLEKMKYIKDKSIDMILCDLPYGTTARNKWDCIIDYNKLWKCYRNVSKNNACIALFAQSPFDKTLAVSNINMYRYEWIIEKTKATGHLNAKKMPMKAHENILIFYNKLPMYNPQMTYNNDPVHSFTKYTDAGTNYGKTKTGISGGGQTTRYPRDILKFKWDTQKSSLHPTQKPVKLLKYMIKTYTNENEVVLDNCFGSCSTGIACIETNRNFIGIEKDDNYFNVGVKRIKDYLKDNNLEDQWEVNIIEDM